MKRFAMPACNPKNVPRVSGGMIFEIMDVHELAVKPPPSPCQVNKIKVMTRPALVPMVGSNNATMANPKNGMRSWIVVMTTLRLYLRKRET